MKITIDIPEQDINLLSKWASVSRTLNESMELLVQYSPEKEGCLIERVSNNLVELEDLEPALDSLHYIVRSALWEQERQKRQKAESRK